MTAPGPRVLAIDDEPEIRRILRTVLADAGYAVTTAATAEAGMDEFRRVRPDVVLMDLRLPGMSGLEACGWLRERSNVPIIVLSVIGEERDKVRALDAGADDYLVKPFGTAEMLARVRVALRHAAALKAGTDPVIRVGDLVVDVGHRLVAVGGQAVRLTPTEYEVLKHLAVHAGKVVTHRQLMRAVWGTDHAADTSNTRYTVTQLRKKLGDDPARPRYILTEPGVGYRLRAEDGGPAPLGI
jgi:two-component system KDP operon response regulator KdpE